MPLIDPPLPPSLPPSLPPPLGKHGDKSSYVLSFFLAGVSPLQALTYMSDASNYTYIHPYVQTVNIVERKREEEVGEDGREGG